MFALDDTPVDRSTLPTRLPSLFVLEDPSRKRVWLARAHVYVGFLMSIVGTGVLSIPYTFALLPPELCVVSICAVAVAMASTALALLQAQARAAAQEESDKPFESRAGDKFESLQELATRAGGAPMGYATAIVTAAGVFGGAVGNIQIVRDLMPHVLRLVFGVDEHDSTGVVNAAVLCGIFAAIVFPLCLLRRLSALKTINYISFLLVLLLVGAVGYRAAFPSSSASPSGNDSGFNSTTRSLASIAGSESMESLVASINTTDQPMGRLSERLRRSLASVATTVSTSGIASFAKALSIYNFAYTMHLNLLPLFVELRATDPRGSLRATRRRLTRCIFGSAGFCAALYLAFGYFASAIYTGGAIKGNVLLNLQGDSAMDVPLVAVFVTTSVSFPLHFYPLRAIVEELAFRPRKRGVDVRLVERAAVVLVLLASQVAIALCVPGVETVFALVGATSGLLVCYGFSVAIFLCVCPFWKHRVDQVRAALLLAIVAFMACASGVTVVSVLF